jgi:large subunit ribosomal protein L10
MSEKAIAVKKKVVDELKEKLAKSNLLVLSDYKGFSVKDLTQLRRRFRPADSELKVLKNTLVKRAVNDAGYQGLDQHLEGSTVVLLGYGDPVAPLKVLVDHLKEIEKGEIRAGVVDGAVFGQKELQAIAKLPSREVLIAKVVGGMKSPLYGLVNALNGPLRKLVYALNAIKEKKS